MPALTYSVDTSALFDGLERYYPQALFPALWERIAGLIAEGRLIISAEVWDEARTRDELAKEWCDAQGKDPMVVETDLAVATEVRSILATFPRLVAQQKGRNRADAFVIAVAKLRGAVVVTGEGSNGTENRPKIPFICDQMDIPCYTFIDIARLEGWTF